MANAELGDGYDMPKAEPKADAKAESTVPTKKKEKPDELLDRAKKRAEAAWTADRSNREEGLLDLRFLAGDQWPEDVRRKREQAGRPCMTLDKLSQHRNQVVNDIRMARIGIKAIPVDGKTDPKLAETYTSLMRDIQYHSYAQHVFAEAANGAVSCGIGHFRFLTKYVDDATFDQEILIKLIPYPLSVLWDPAAMEPDRSDAMYCHVLDFLDKQTFKDRYPDARPVGYDIPRDAQNTGGLYWSTPEGTMIAEYWEKVPIKKKLLMLTDGTVISPDDKMEIPPGMEVQAERDVDTHKVVQYLLTGDEILEGPNDFPSKHIPIVPVIGTETHLEDKTIREGLIRKARDPQQLYNYWRTAAAELIALAPKAKWLVTPTMIAEYKHEWEEAHMSPKAYLRYKVDPSATAQGGKPELVPPPQPPAAIWTEAELVDQDIKAATGLYNRSLGDRGNEKSGVAIARVQQEGDVATYHFSDNLGRSLKHAGNIMVDMIPKVYDTPRVLRLLGDDDEFDYKPVNTMMTDDDGQRVLLNDLSAGRFDIRISIGPSYTTQRLEAADAMLEYGKIDPSAMPLIRDLFVKNMDWPGRDEIAERLKRTIPPQVLADDEQAPETPEAQAAKQRQQEQEQQQAALSTRMMGAKVSAEEGKARKLHAEADATEKKAGPEAAEAFGKAQLTTADADRARMELGRMKLMLDAMPAFSVIPPTDY